MSHLISNRFIFSSLVSIGISLVAIPASATTCIDNDGDGWGWDGSKSCLISPLTNDKDCVDPDGDGWGWNGHASCRLPEVQVESPLIQFPVIQEHDDRDGSRDDFPPVERTNSLVPLAIDPRFVVYEDEDSENIETFETYVSDFLTLDPNSNTILDQIYASNGPVILRQSEEFGATINSGLQYEVLFGDPTLDLRVNIKDSSRWTTASTGSLAFHELTHVTTAYAAGLNTVDTWNSYAFNGFDRRVVLEEIAVGFTNTLYRERKGELPRGSYLLSYTPEEMKDIFPGLTIEEIEARIIEMAIEVPEVDPILMKELLEQMSLGGIEPITEPSEEIISPIRGRTRISTITLREERSDGWEEYTLERYSDGTSAKFMGTSKTATDGRTMRGGAMRHSPSSGGSDSKGNLTDTKGASGPTGPQGTRTTETFGPQ